uniref:Hydroxybutyrate dehydrogenase n=1 Tax=Heliothis virescens TaxID=7102 RepID=D2SNW1_HELVI
MSFKDKVVLVTGGSSGIGAAIAIKFAEEGAKVAIVGRNQEKLKNTAKKCGNPLVIVADVTKDEDVKRIASETLKNFGKLDVLVNNAGIAPLAGIQDDNTVEIFDKIMATNLRSVVLLTHLTAAELVKTKGNIINISSAAALKALKGMGAYCTSKAALDHFTRAIALELAPSGVRVNSVNPGPVVTDIFDTILSTKEEQEKFLKQVVDGTALGRISEAEEIADLVLFLASDKSRGITGSSYVTDNGIFVEG